MYCQDCGQEIPDHSKTCSLCGRAQKAFDPAQISTGLIPALLLTFCCCQPLAVIAIYFAARSCSHISAKNYEEAEAAAKAAKVWSFILFIISMFVWGVFLFTLLVRNLLMEAE